MNHRLLTEAEKLATKKKRNKKRTLRRKRKRTAALISRLGGNCVTGVWLAMYPEAVNAILGGTPWEKRRVIEEIEMMERTGHVPGNQLWTLLKEGDVRHCDCSVPTHEFVQKGKKWSLRKYKPFTLW